MDFEQYFAGVEPGGFKDKYEIKLLVCYLLSTVRTPLTEAQLNAIFQNSGLVNYFAYTTAFAELKESDMIAPAADADGKEAYRITELGEDSVRKLEDNLPRSVRDAVVETAMRLLSQLERNRNVAVTTETTEDGTVVRCRILDVGSDLMDLKLYASNPSQADWLAEAFREKSDYLYRVILATATQDQKLLNDLLTELSKQG